MSVSPFWPSALGHWGPHSAGAACLAVSDGASHPCCSRLLPVCSGFSLPHQHPAPLPDLHWWQLVPLRVPSLLVCQLTSEVADSCGVWQSFLPFPAALPCTYLLSLTVCSWSGFWGSPRIPRWGLSWQPDSHWFSLVFSNAKLSQN